MADNISLLQQLEGFGAQCTLPSLPGALKPRLREVTTLPSWVYCFLAYIGIQTTDTRTRDFIAYARLAIREAQRHGGSGWLEYDRLFRQQVAIDPSLQWANLHPGIQAATIVGRSSGPSSGCTLCREPDHTADNCALSYLQQPTPRTPFGGGTGAHGGRQSDRAPRPPARVETSKLICISWNRGTCAYPDTCRYHHICATCSRRHKAKDCAETPAGSFYKRATTQSRP